jgi:alpha-beta hydrolase superfamily lysophospholipase
MVSRARLLADRGYSVLMIDLQAHGGTPGPAITLGLRESADVRAAHDWLRGLEPPRRIGVVGCSLGGASVLLEPQPSGFDAVVLEAVFSRLSLAVENRVRAWVGPVAPALAPLMLAQVPLRLHVSACDLEPIRSIARLGAPVLVVAGSDDRYTTLAESNEIFAAAAEPKEMWVVAGARHEDLLAYDPAGYTEHVVGFFDRRLRPPGSM